MRIWSRISWFMRLDCEPFLTHALGVASGVSQMASGEPGV